MGSATNAAPAPVHLTSTSRLGTAWVLHALALALHVADEALTGFLSVYNPTARAIRPQGWWFPPTFTFGVWLGGLILLVLVLLLLSPFFFRNARWVRPIGYIFVAINVSNAIGHTLGTILGHSVMSVRFARPMPGFYSSPILLAAAIYLLVQLRATRDAVN
ncbi:MAG TPA: hypothetical protein VKW06_02955 [Candidatus Angelobacter sp.]|nr:hypothetical protein [Candidatus Angelobacter sp.]